jgi:hypothetical protein
MFNFRQLCGDTCSPDTHLPGHPGGWAPVLVFMAACISCGSEGPSALPAFLVSLPFFCNGFAGILYKLWTLSLLSYSLGRWIVLFSSRSLDFSTLTHLANPY